ncbi:unnamed protein product [Thelazia callipaeda]|uniref:Cytochrome_P460 domain-containing protein n=1 Tax=Thelazia callipaeda TaxID=103827 RepID=A0A0N5D7W9_THECL|nr:unnamed protein product [Thelazia callipaeda]
MDRERIADLFDRLKSDHSYTVQSSTPDQMVNKTEQNTQQHEQSRPVYICPDYVANTKKRALFTSGIETSVTTEMNWREFKRRKTAISNEQTDPLVTVTVSNIDTVSAWFTSAPYHPNYYGYEGRDFSFNDSKIRCTICHIKNP